MKKGWKVKQLSQVCQLDKKKHDGNDLPYIGMEDISSGTGQFLGSQEPRQVKSSTFVFTSDHVLYGRLRPYLNKALIPEFTGHCSTEIFPLLAEHEVSKQYLFYWITSDSQVSKINDTCTGARMPRANFKEVLTFPIPIPPLAEQEAIVEVLDKAFTAIDLAKANLEQNITNAKELFQSKLNQIFSQKGEGWVETTIGEIGKVSMCKRILKQQTTVTGDIPFFKIGTFGKIANAFIDTEIYETFKEKYSFPKKGDVLISASGTIGRRVVYDGTPAYFQDSNIVWIDNSEDQILNEYLYQFYGVCDWNPSKGATISRLYNADLRRIKISFPCILEQRSLIETMCKLDRLKESLLKSYQTKLTSLEELKKSILQKAFAGELT